MLVVKLNEAPRQDRARTAQAVEDDPQVRVDNALVALVPHCPIENDNVLYHSLNELASRHRQCGVSDKPV
jgi:hypothetical protein